MATWRGAGRINHIKPANLTGSFNQIAQHASWHSCCLCAFRVREAAGVQARSLRENFGDNHQAAY